MMEEGQQLSVVILSRKNASASILAAIQAIRAQETVPVTLYLLNLNDPADPYTLSLQDDLLSMPDVHLLTVKGTHTMGQLRNIVLEKITTPFVSFAFTEERWMPEKARLQLQALCATETSNAPDAPDTPHAPDVPSEPATPAAPEDSLPPVCYCGYELLAHSGSAVKRTLLPPEHLTMEGLLLLPDEIAPSAFVYRTDAIRQAGGFHPSLDAHLDIEFCLRLLSQGKTIAGIYQKLFTQNGQSGMVTPEKQYKSVKALYYQFYDLFLRRKKLMFSYNMLLAHHAAQCKEWVLMLIHMVVAIARAPFHALGRASRSSLQFLRYLLFYHFSHLRVARCKSALRKALKPLHQSEYQPLSVQLPSIDSAVSGEAVQIVSAVRPFLFAFRRTGMQVILPDDLTVLPRGLFAGCKTLVSVRIPASVQRIEEGAFLDCTSLEHVIFERDAMLSTVGDYAFAGCRKLRTLELPGTITSFGAYAFAGCEMLDTPTFRYATGVEDTFPAMLTTLPEGIFAGCKALSQILFPENSMLSSINTDAFLGCESMHSVRFTSVIQTIGAYAFAQCVSFEHLVMPRIDAVQVLGRGCFMNCRHLNYFRIPYALTQVPPYGFYGCTSLRNVKFNRNLQIIATKAFSHCDQLTSVSFLMSVNCATDAFDATTQVTLE